MVEVEIVAQDVEEKVKLKKKNLEMVNLLK